MKVLVTSGGTKVRIDRVRSITNMSRGTFGSQICDSFLDRFDSTGDDEVVFFYAKNSRLPKSNKLNHVRFVEYDTFDDYRSKIKELLTKEHFDIIVLAAAVSDYGVANYFDGKYHSSDNMTIQLVKLPKVITEVRNLALDSTICGFKLLVDSTDDELRDAMEKQFSDNGIELCVGNDLRDIKANNHRLTIKISNVLNPTSEYFVYNKYDVEPLGMKLSDKVVDKCFEAYSLKNTKL